MKIMFVNTLYTPNMIGGAEKSVQLLAESLYKRGHEPIVISTAKEDDEKTVNGVRVFYLKHRNLYWSIESKKQSKFLKPIWHMFDVYNPFMKKRITEIINQTKPDVIHTNNLVGLSLNSWNIAKKNKIPVVHTLRDYSLMCVKGSMFKETKNCNKQCNVCKAFTLPKKIASNNDKVDYLIGNSQFIVNKHKMNGFFNNVSSKRIYNGTSIDINNSNSNVASTSTDKIKFLYMGRIDETKGVNQLLDVFGEIDNAELYLAGRVEWDDLNNKIQNGEIKGNIHFLGFTNPSDILPKVDVTIIPSLWHEPLPRVALESYSYGKPVIGTNRGGIPESIKDGETGFIYDPEIEGSLKDIVNKIIENPKIIINMVEGLSSYLQQFDINITVEEYEKVYNKIVELKN